MTISYYYIKWRGRSRGPYSAAELKSMYEEERINNFYTASEDCETWIPVMDIINSSNEVQHHLSSQDSQPPEKKVLRVKIKQEDNKTLQLPAIDEVANRFNPENIEEQTEKMPGFSLRLQAFMLDFAVFTAIGMLILFLLWGLLFIAGYDGLLIRKIMKVYVPLLFFVLSWLYEVCFELSKMAATPGKYWIGLIILTEDYEPIDLSQANVRYFAKILSAITLFVGWLPIYGTRKASLHDLMAKTTVCTK